MSVVTTADEKIGNTKQLITEAYRELVDVLDSDTWGHDDLKEEYIDEVARITIELLNIKRRL